MKQRSFDLAGLETMAQTAETLVKTLLSSASTSCRCVVRTRRDSKKSTFLFVTQPALADFTLSHMHGVVITARDGLELPCYLSLPVLPDGQASPMAQPGIELPSAVVLPVCLVMI